MNPIALIDKYYPEDNELKKILLKHSKDSFETQPFGGGQST